MKYLYAIEPARAADVMALYQQGWPDLQRSLHQIELCLQGSSLSVGIEYQGRLIGFARVLSDFIFKAVIYDVVVDREYRHQSLGRQLIDLVRNHPQLLAVNQFELMCLPHNVGFYQQLGFTEKPNDITFMRFQKGA